MSKVTLGDLKKAGFKAVAGDELFHKRDNYTTTVKIASAWNKDDEADEGWFIKSLAPRPNTGTQPVSDDCVVEVEQHNGKHDSGCAGDFMWLNDKCSLDIESWKPSLKHLEQQMNDNQESAMNISERDVENAFIKQDDAAVERELVESDESPLSVQVGGNHYKTKIQPVEFIHANKLGFFEGNVIKYVTRHKAKNGKQDLEKAIHYLQMLIELEYKESGDNK